MKKLLCIATLLGCLSLSAKDFTYNGIIYTVTDEDAMTVETKAGTTEPDPEDSEKVIRIAGNDAAGFITLPSTVRDENGEEYTLTRLGDDSFSNCSYLFDVTLPETVTEIGSYAFYGCSLLSKAELPVKLKTIGEYAFFGCLNLDSIDLPNSITKIKEGTFAGCSFKSIKLPENLLSIEDYAFMMCTSLTEIKIPDYTIIIDLGAFYACTSLKTVYLPEYLIFPGSMIFGSCSNITKVYYLTDSPVTASKNIFDDKVYTQATLYVPEGSKSVMESKLPWTYFVNIVEENVGSVDDIVEDDLSQPVEYFDLNGRKIESPERGQVLIERQGNKTRKVIY